MCYRKISADVNERIFYNFTDKLWRDVYYQVEQSKWPQASNKPKETVRDCCVHILRSISVKLNEYCYRK